jgi:hypothetical protein
LPELPRHPKIATVDHSLLRSWLGLPGGPWPPDHYALIGLSPGRSDPEEVERLVLDRMARLRSHQLLHPELVTEGMNRLAQALVCLTDPAARAAYDAELGILPALPPQYASDVGLPPPPSPISAGEAIPGFPIPTDDEPAPPDATQIIEIPFTPGLVPPDTGSPPPFEIIEDNSPLPVNLPYEVVAEPMVGTLFIAPPRMAWQPNSRRELYTRLASVRRVRSAWARLESLLGNPQEPLDRPIRVLALLEAACELRSSIDAVPDVIGEPWLPGGMIAALIRQPLSLDALRVLLPDQRQALAQDWREGDADLDREYNRLRELSRSGRKRRRPFRRRNRLMRAAGWSLRNPESLLVGLGIVLLAVAFFRASTGR